MLIGTDSSYLYYNNTNLYGAHVLSQIITQQDVTNMRYTFAYCTNLQSITSYNYEIGYCPEIITNEDGSYTVNLSNSITYNTNKQYTYTYDDITSYVCDMYTTYEYDNFIERVSYSYQGNCILDNIGYAYEFYYDNILTYHTYTYNFESFNAAYVTSFNHSFYGCENLTNADLTYIDFGSCTDAQFMFGNCYNLTSIKFGRYKPNYHLNADNIFYGCYNLAYVYIPFEYMKEYGNIVGQCGKTINLYNYDVNDYNIHPEAYTYICTVNTEIARYITFTINNIDTLLIESWQYHDSERRKTIHNILTTTFPDYKDLGDNHKLVISLKTRDGYVELFSYEFNSQLNKDIVGEKLLTEPISHTYKIEGGYPYCESGFPWENNYNYNITLKYSIRSIDSEISSEYEILNKEEILFFDKEYKLLYLYTDDIDNNLTLKTTSYAYTNKLIEQEYATDLILDLIPVSSVDIETLEIINSTMHGYNADDKSLSIYMGNETPFVEDPENLTYLYADYIKTN